MAVVRRFLPRARRRRVERVPRDATREHEKQFDRFQQFQSFQRLGSVVERVAGVTAIACVAIAAVFALWRGVFGGVAVLGGGVLIGLSFWSMRGTVDMLVAMRLGGETGRVSAGF